MTYNLTCAAGIFAKARTGNVPSKLINVPARIACSARRTKLRLPITWPWQTEWERFFATDLAPPRAD